MVAAVNLFTNLNTQELKERYKNNNSFGRNVRVGATNPMTSTGGAEPVGYTGVVDNNVNIQVPKADKRLAYAGFYSPMYGQPNYNGQLLDLPYC